MSQLTLCTEMSSVYDVNQALSDKWLTFSAGSSGPPTEPTDLLRNFKHLDFEHDNLG